MPRNDVAVTLAPGRLASPQGAQTAGIAVTMEAADTVNFNQCPHTGRELIIAQNTGVGAHSVTITSAPSAIGRLGHITAESIAAGAIRVYGPFPQDGWMQVDARLYFQADHAEVLFGVVLLP